MRLYFLFFVSWLFLSGCSQPAEPAPPKLRPVTYVQISTSGGASTQSFSGIAQSSRTAALSFKVSGTLQQLPVEVGQQVRQGALIARIDPTDYSVQYEQAVAQLRSSETQIEQAEAQLIAARSAYQRTEKLYENNSVSLSEYEQARANYESAQSQYNAAQAAVAASKAQVRASSNQVDYATLRAPFAGVITDVMADENELVGSGNPVAVLSADDDLEVQVGVPEALIARIKKGMKVNVTFSVIRNQVFEGEVSEVSFSTQQGGATYPVTIRLVEPSEAIRPGMASEVAFRFDEAQLTNGRPVIPPAAIGEDTGGRFVFLLRPEDSIYVASRQAIQLGPLVENGYVVEEGLEAGQLIATAGLKSLLDGMRVRLIDQND